MTGSPYVPGPGSTPGRLVIRNCSTAQMIVNAVTYLVVTVLGLGLAFGLARGGAVSAGIGWGGFGIIVVLDVYGITRFFYYVVVLEGSMLMERALLGSRGCDLAYSNVFLTIGGDLVKPPVPPMQAGKYGPILEVRDGRTEINVTLRPSPAPEKLLALADAMVVSRQSPDIGAELAAAALRQWAAEAGPGAAAQAGPAAAGQA